MALRKIENYIWGLYIVLVHELHEGRSVTPPAPAQKGEGAHVRTHSRLVGELEPEPDLC